MAADPNRESLNDTPLSDEEGTELAIKFRSRWNSFLIGLVLALLLFGAYYVQSRKQIEKDKANAQRLERELEETRVALESARDDLRESRNQATKLMVRQAIRMAEAGKDSEAEELAKTAVTTHPDSPWGYYALGRLSQLRENIELASKQFSVAISVSPLHRQSRLALGQITKSGKDIDLAIEVIDDTESDWRDLMAAGDICMAARRYAAAERAFALVFRRTRNGRSLPQKLRDELKEKSGSAKAWRIAVKFQRESRDLPEGKRSFQFHMKFKEMNGLRELTINTEKRNGVYTSFSIAGGEYRYIQLLAGMPIENLLLTSSLLEDLSPLRGMPLKSLSLEESRVDDLSQLEGMALKKLNLEETRIRDISALKGMPLEELDLEKTNVTDLSPLTGMPLRSLDLCETRVRDISVLNGMPLTRLNLENCHQLHDLTPLKGCPDLEHLTLPPDYDDITFLRRMPSLKTIGRKATPVEEFWRSD